MESGRCADGCRKRLYDTRQVRLALDRDMNRVQRVFIADDGLLRCAVSARAASGLDRDSRDPRRRAAARAVAGRDPAARRSTAQAPRVYLIDPLGNLMMFYAADAKPKGMLEDMKRLLRLSSIG